MIKKDLRLQIKIKNNRLLIMLEASPGFKSVAQWSRDNGFHPTKVGNYLNFKSSPVKARDMSWKADVIKIASILGCLPDDLFPEYLWAPRQNAHQIELTESQCRGFLEHAPVGPEDAYVELEKKHKVLTALSGCTRREEEVIKRRFGLGMYTEHTVEEVAEEFDISTGRVRQIEHKAYWRLLYNKEMKDLVEGEKRGPSVVKHSDERRISRYERRRMYPIVTSATE